MLAIVTPEEMGAIDRAAPEPVEVLIDRAGAATARAALALLGGAYGRRVTVLVGKGHNGDDGRAAAHRLRRRGVRCAVLGPDDRPDEVGPCDLVVDAVLGTGFRGGYRAPRVPSGVPVLAVDIPSGVDGLTGEASEQVLAATATVTFAALKPGLVLHPGAALAGRVEVADIGLDTSSARAHLVTDDDVAGWLPERPVDAHKWRSAVWVVAGSPGMTGAAHLAARAAQRGGAGYVRLSSPGVVDDPRRPTEAVGVALPADDWAREVLDGLDRFRALVVGPGLGRDPGTAAQVRRLVAAAPVPVLVDGDGLTALGDDPAAVLAERTAPTVLTPHDGEHAGLTGAAPGPDRLAAARALAAATGAVVLLKGPTTVVAGPDGAVLVTATGDARLATAGTGDVLSGLGGALLASGLDPLRAAAVAAHLHGRAGAVGSARGLVAGDLVDHLPLVLDRR
ncbi:MAG TPA: NAD(P)H-hydrate dehydratase [Acidimicrobiales bacterium]|nr:NAD(P)H-hydrate dehydratase [Acidimicrobiales bacterium]